MWEAAAQVRQARAARAVSGGGRSAWAQAWRSQRQWEAEHRRGSTAEAVAGRRHKAEETEEEAGCRLAAEADAGRRRASVVEVRHRLKVEKLRVRELERLLRSHRSSTT